MSDKKLLDKAIDALAEAMIPGFGAVYAATTSAAQMFEDAAIPTLPGDPKCPACQMLAKVERTKEVKG